MPTTFNKPNRYPATCISCGNTVPGGEGNLARTDSGTWAAAHPDGTCPPTTPTPTTPTTLVNSDGIYRDDDGTIYKVQQARQGSSRLYAKRLTFTDCLGCDRCNGIDPHKRGHFTYAPGSIHKITAEMRLTAEDAAAYGRLYGICIACGAELTDEVSIARGIGPVCRRYF